MLWEEVKDTFWRFRVCLAVAIGATAATIYYAVKLIVLPLISPIKEVGEDIVKAVESYSTE